jgi:hypothetical protein
MAPPCHTSHPSRLNRRLITRVAGWCLLVLACGIHEPLRADLPRSTQNGDDLASDDAVITAEDREHWAFQPIKPQKVPSVKNTRWVKNPLDRFVLAKLE